MIHIVVVTQMKEDQMPFVKEQLAIVAAKTNQEEGCICYKGYCSTNKPDTICIVEEWESQECLDKHLASAHIKTWLDVTKDLIVSKNLNFLEPVDCQ